MDNVQPNETGSYLDLIHNCYCTVWQDAHRNCICVADGDRCEQDAGQRIGFHSADCMSVACVMSRLSKSYSFITSLLT